MIDWNIIVAQEFVDGNNGHCDGLSAAQYWNWRNFFMEAMPATVSYLVTIGQEDILIVV